MYRDVDENRVQRTDPQWAVQRNSEVMLARGRDACQSDMAS